PAYAYCAHRYLHSFPTRRSSDLAASHRSSALPHPSEWAVCWCRSPKRTPPSPGGRPGAGHAAGDGDGPGTDGGAVSGAAASGDEDRKSTRLNSSHVKISYAVFCL